MNIPEHDATLTTMLTLICWHATNTIIDDLTCFIAFYFCDPYSNVKFLTVACLLSTKEEQYRKHLWNQYGHYYGYTCTPTIDY